MVRIGLIGVGNVGRAHAEAIRSIPQAELTAVADPNEKAASQLAQNHQATAYAEVYEMIEKEDLQAVIIASPTPFHFFQARTALESGLHVYIEPPLTRELREAEELLQIARGRNSVVTVGHALRCFPEYTMMRDRVIAGGVGKPGMIRLGRRIQHPRGWTTNFESSGGVVLDAMIHELDYLRWTFGPVQRVFCRGLQGRAPTDKFDYALASVRLESGAIAHIEASWCHYGQNSLGVEIAGDRSLIRYDNQDAVPLRVSLIDWNSGGCRLFSESPVAKPAFRKMLESFLAAVRGEGENPVPLSEGVEAVRLALAVLESLQSGRPAQPEGASAA